MPQQAQTLVLIALMVVAFYFLILRPQKRRQQALQKTMRSLEPGTRVLLGSGVFGTIVSIGDKQATLEVSPGLHLTVLKQAIVRTVTEADEDIPATAEDELETGYATSTAVEPDYRRPETLPEPEPLMPAPDPSETEQDPRR